VTTLSDGELRIPAQALLNRDLPPEFTDGDGLMAVNFGGYLIRTDEHTVVVDTGIGGGAIPELPIGSLPDRLRDAGVAPEDVDTVIFTHLHFDHVGWSGLFTRARFHAHATDWAHWVTDATPETGPGAAKTSGRSRRRSGSPRSPTVWCCTTASAPRSSPE
jgi:glyoxylase-like metal-dependent hydrolase (beta-lactamase superfamily II)